MPGRLGVVNSVEYRHPTSRIAAPLRFWNLDSPNSKETEVCQMAEKKGYIIRIQGTLVEVTEEVYLAYFRMDRQARGMEEKDRYNNTAQYDALDTDEMLGVESLKDTDAVPVEDAAIAHMMAEKLRNCLMALPEAERRFIFQRYWEGRSQVELATKYGTSQQVLSYREKQILAKLKILLTN